MLSDCITLIRGSYLVDVYSPNICGVVALNGVFVKNINAVVNPRRDHRAAPIGRLRRQKCTVLPSLDSIEPLLQGPPTNTSTEEPGQEKGCGGVETANGYQGTKIDLPGCRPSITTSMQSAEEDMYVGLTQEEKEAKIEKRRKLSEEIERIKKKEAHTKEGLHLWKVATLSQYLFRRKTHTARASITTAWTMHGKDTVVEGVSPPFRNTVLAEDQIGALRPSRTPTGVPSSTTNTLQAKSSRVARTSIEPSSNTSGTSYSVYAPDVLDSDPVGQLPGPRDGTSASITTRSKAKDLWAVARDTSIRIRRYTSITPNSISPLPSDAAWELDRQKEKQLLNEKRRGSDRFYNVVRQAVHAEKKANVKDLQMLTCDQDAREVELVYGDPSAFEENSKKLMHTVSSFWMRLIAPKLESRDPHSTGRAHVNWSDIRCDHACLQNFFRHSVSDEHMRRRITHAFLSKKSSLPLIDLIRLLFPDARITALLDTKQKLEEHVEKEDVECSNAQAQAAAKEGKTMKMDMGSYQRESSDLLGALDDVVGVLDDEEL